MADKKGPDMELKKAFIELQSKMLDTRTKMKFSDMQVRLKAFYPGISLNMNIF